MEINKEAERADKKTDFEGNHRIPHFDAEAWAYARNKIGPERVKALDFDRIQYDVRPYDPRGRSMRGPPPRPGWTSEKPLTVLVLHASDELHVPNHTSTQIWELFGKNGLSPTLADSWIEMFQEGVENCVVKAVRTFWEIMEEMEAFNAGKKEVNAGMEAFNAGTDDAAKGGDLLVLLPGGYYPLMVQALEAEFAKHASEGFSREKLVDAFEKFVLSGGKLVTECAGTMLLGNKIYDPDGKRITRYGTPLNLVPQCSVGIVQWSEREKRMQGEDPDTGIVHALMVDPHTGRNAGRAGWMSSPGVVLEDDVRILGEHKSGTHEAGTLIQSEGSEDRESVFDHIELMSLYALRAGVALGAQHDTLRGSAHRVPHYGSICARARGGNTGGCIVMLGPHWNMSAAASTSSYKGFCVPERGLSELEALRRIFGKIGLLNIEHSAADDLTAHACL